MGTCATGLVTKGYICCGHTEDQLISCDQPQFAGAVEVRPKLSYAATSPEFPPGTPRPMTALDVKPKTGVRTSNVVVPTVKPVTVTAEELRPKITKAEEEG